jgi:hypothetical protein
VAERAGAAEPVAAAEPAARSGGPAAAVAPDEGVAALASPPEARDAAAAQRAEFAALAGSAELAWATPRRVSAVAAAAPPVSVPIPEGSALFRVFAPKRQPSALSRETLPSLAFSARLRLPGCSAPKLPEASLPEQVLHWDCSCSGPAPLRLAARVVRLLCLGPAVRWLSVMLRGLHSRVAACSAQHSDRPARPECPA